MTASLRPFYSFTADVERALAVLPFDRRCGWLASADGLAYWCSEQGVATCEVCSIRVCPNHMAETACVQCAAPEPRRYVKRIRGHA
jgi:hypothetical protein